MSQDYKKTSRLPNGYKSNINSEGEGASRYVQDCAYENPNCVLIRCWLGDEGRWEIGKRLAEGANTGHLWGARWHKTQCLFVRSCLNPLGVTSVPCLRSE
jgi:hypothetical protein